MFSLHKSPSNHSTSQLIFHYTCKECSLQTATQRTRNANIFLIQIFLFIFSPVLYLQYIQEPQVPQSSYSNCLSFHLFAENIAGPPTNTNERCLPLKLIKQPRVELFPPYISLKPFYTTLHHHYTSVRNVAMKKQLKEQELPTPLLPKLFF